MSLTGKFTWLTEIQKNILSMDTLSRLERSKVMSRIRSNGNVSTELAMVALLRREKMGGWRRRHRMLGKPEGLEGPERKGFKTRVRRQSVQSTSSSFTFLWRFSNCFKKFTPS